jgi:AraC family transcriptional regulator
VGQLGREACQRVDSRIGAVQPVPAVSDRALGGMPEGLQFRHVTLAPGSWPEGHLTWHALAVHRNGTREFVTLPGGRRRVSASPGLLDFAPANWPFTVSWNEPFEVASLVFSPSLLSEFIWPSGRSPELREEYSFEDPLLVHLLLGLDSEMEAGNPSGPLFVETLGAAAVAQLVRTHAGPQPKLVRSMGGLSPNRSRKLLEYIEANLHRQLSLRELAGMVDMNLFHLLRMFKASFGVPPHRYVLERRMRKAKDLLRDSELPISEIAFRCGYAEQSSFARAFVRLTGVYPRSYRKSVEQ